MAGPSSRIPEATFKDNEEIDDILEAAKKAGKMRDVPMNELSQVAEDFNKKLAAIDEKESPKKKIDWADDEELDDLLGPVQEPPETRFTFGRELIRPAAQERVESTFVNRQVKPLIDEDDKEDPEEFSYQESYASQRETTQLRDEMDELSTRLKEMESKLALALKEREILPNKLETLRSDINGQLTLILDRLQSTTEANVSPKAVSSAIATVETMKLDVDDQLRSASSYAATELKPTSPLVLQTADLRGKRKFKPVK